jgi:uncharacterized metal-binding protein
MQKTCCGTGSGGSENGYEVARIEKTDGACRLCEMYAERQAAKPVAVICCEGACLRGEVARQAANLVCHSLAREKTVRVCLGGAFTKDTAQRRLVRKAARVIAVEGCPVDCASRTIRGVIEGLDVEVIRTHELFDFDKSLFGIDEMAPEEIRRHSDTVARHIAGRL